MLFTDPSYTLLLSLTLNLECIPGQYTAIWGNRIRLESETTCWIVPIALSKGDQGFTCEEEEDTSMSFV